MTISNNGTQNTIINLSSTGDFDIQDNGTSALKVQDDGKVGINQSTPLAGLHIKGVEATFDAHHSWRLQVPEQNTREYTIRRE
ncbi:MAG: hypothetical protein IPN10_01580 [Saprospiraceae bacterium]|nr:hypothetical protein [Saprospiraceae bacterium]